MAPHVAHRIDIDAIRHAGHTGMVANRAYRGAGTPWPMSLSMVDLEDAVQARLVALRNPALQQARAHGNARAVGVLRRGDRWNAPATPPSVQATPVVVSPLARTTAEPRAACHWRTKTTPMP